jgi:hypothetical protein
MTSLPMSSSQYLSQPSQLTRHQPLLSLRKSQQTSQATAQTPRTGTDAKKDKSGDKEEGVEEEEQQTTA